MYICAGDIDEKNAECDWAHAAVDQTTAAIDKTTTAVTQAVAASVLMTATDLDASGVWADHALTTTRHAKYASHTK